MVGILAHCNTLAKRPCYYQIIEELGISKILDLVWKSQVYIGIGVRRMSPQPDATTMVIDVFGISE